MRETAGSEVRAVEPEMYDEAPTEEMDPVDAAVGSIGERLRALRTSQSIGLRELARRIGVTPSLLSQMERGGVNPSVVTLFRLADVLGTTTDYFFGADEVTPDRVPIVRPSGRVAIQLEGGIRWERLTPTDEHGVEFMEVTYPPGSASTPDMLRHPGRDYVLVLDGVLDVGVGFNTYRLEVGDSVAFDATLPHRFSNPGDKPARLVSLVLDRRDRS